MGPNPTPSSGQFKVQTLPILSLPVDSSSRSSTMAERQCKYSCSTGAETLEWINAIINFIRPYYDSLTNAHVVNFFKDRLWESLDHRWTDCLSREPVENLLLIPSGVVQDHWPDSLKDFVATSSSLAFPREQADLQKVLPGLKVVPLNSVLSQGMNMKKKHEVEVLSAVVSSVANSVGAQTIVDVGAGQGYLAQVLSFQYQHSVVAIDACSHHGNVTGARAERIRKYYAAQMHKSSSGSGILKVPKTITCHIMSAEMLKALSNVSLNGEDVDKLELTREVADKETSLVLAGLHACGDLSVTMLKTFVESNEVKAVVSIGCCYNLLSEGPNDIACSECGFPMSHGVKSAGISLGKSSRDLACQSAERWRSLESNNGLHNFELHAFRAAFQMVLCAYYPESVAKSPSIGRQGKALRRKQQRRLLQSPMHCQESKEAGTELCKDDFAHGLVCDGTGGDRETPTVDKCLLFKRFCLSGLFRLGVKPLEDIDFHEIWKEASAFAELIGPYWSLRAALGPVLETLILLDRLLFLQEQGHVVEAVMLPIFEPTLSPRNVVIVARKNLIQT